MSGVQGSAYWQVTELAFLDSLGVDVSVGGVASASSIYSASYAAALAFDKNLGTDYCSVSGGVPAWLQYRHPAPVSIAKVRMRWASNSTWMPAGSGSITVRALNDDGTVAERYTVELIAGAFVANTEAVFALVPAEPIKTIAAFSTVTVAQGAPTGAIAVTGALSHLMARDVEFGGRGCIYGTVTDHKSKLPLSCRVRLFRSRDGMLARETWSKADGSYRFEGINERYEYDVEAWDHHKNYFTAVANNQLPEVMP